ncbi:MAG: RluA family pseudouridine synthase [Acidobacteria bacterium]|nr:RluA family pseudouridine synthase [Acidobacteriota bacterium]
MPIRTYEATIPAAADRQPLDDVLARLWPHLASTQLRRVVRAGGCYVDGRCCWDEEQRVAAGQRLTLVVDEERPIRQDSLSPGDIIFEDPDLLVLLKPSGLPVNLSATGAEGSLQTVVAGYLAGQTPAHSPEVIHRLDRLTSGLVLFGKNKPTERRLYALFRENRIAKTYLALVSPPPAEAVGLVDRPLAGRRNRYQVATVGGRPALTRYRTVGVNPASVTALLDVHPLTGRTHQIRVHLAWTGSPVLGDTVYGGRPWPAGFGLHAWRLQLPHPRSGAMLKLSAPPPSVWTEDFSCLLDTLRS